MVAAETRWYRHPKLEYKERTLIFEKFVKENDIRTYSLRILDLIMSPFEEELSFTV